jgi:ATP-binding cassette, subfamily B, bacterial MsbA
MSNISANKFLFNLATERPVYIICSIILSLSSAVFNGVGTALLIPILVVFLGDSDNNSLPNKPAIIKQFFAFFDRFEGEQKMIVMIGLVVLAIILKNLANYASAIIGIRYTKYLVCRMQLESFSLLCRVGIDYYAKNKIGDILFKINREIDRTALAIKSGQRILIVSITILTFIYLLILISWQLTLVCTILLAIIAFANQFLIFRSKSLGILLSQKSKEYSRKIIELLTGIRLIKTVANEDKEYQEIEKLIKAKDKAQLDNQVISEMIGPINEVAGMIMILALIMICRYLYTEQMKDFAPILLTYLIVLFRLLPYVGQLNNARTQFANSSPSAEIVANFLREDNKPFLQSGDVTFTKLRSGIKFEAVTFAYPNHAKLVLDKIDIWIPQGKTIALVGSSGAGKSTIADLLPRFYDPLEGSILIDGQNLREYDIKSIRKAMGVVSQDTFLFNNSITNNIAYGLENVSESDIIIAAKRANAYEFITQLPKGFDTEVGDRGVMLSGGQKQRIAIARALLRDPDILILDEATSALDTVSEKLVQEAIEELCRDRTTLVIAHRLSTIQKAHQIVVLNQGKVMEVGSHDELIQKGDFYSRLYSMQFKNTNQSHQQQLANKISNKLISQANSNLSYEIRNNLNALLNSLQLVNEGLIDNSQEQEKILDESYQSAKNMLFSLKQYEQKIHQGLEDTNS